MKKILIYFLLFFLFILTSYGQDKIDVAMEKTTYLIFDSNIEHVDVGSNSVSFKIEGSIVKLKAAELNFVDTNMLIYFKGVSKMFFLSYNENPLLLLHEFSNEQDNSLDSVQPLLTEFEIVQKELINSRSFSLPQLLEEKAIIRVSDYNQGISVAINNIFVDEKSLYFSFHIENGSSVAYDINDIKSMVKNKKKSKSTSLKSIYKNLEIIDSYNFSDKSVRSETVHDLVIQIKKITLSNDEIMFWVIEEKGGERNFTLKVKPSDLINSIKL